jgi:hypothetical protein
MPRLLLIIVLLFVRVGKGLVALKNELITGILYFIVLAPMAFVRKFLPSRRRKFHTHNSSWVDSRAEDNL